MRPRTVTEDRVFEVLMSLGEAPMATLCGAVGCHEQSARGVLAGLIARGEVVADEEPAEGPGRRRVIYRPNWTRRNQSEQRDAELRRELAEIKAEVVRLALLVAGAAR